MSLTRDDLVNDVGRRALAESELKDAVLCDAAMKASLDKILSRWDGRSPIWVFGYGSLIWNPQLDVCGSRLCRVYGFHRRLCLWSKVNRGTCEHPGLVLGLEPGGAVTGVAYEIDAAKVEHELTLLWRREMFLNSYTPRWVSARTQTDEQFSALTFQVNRAAPNYAPPMTDAQALVVLKQACGRYGSSADYLRATVAGLRAHGIKDPYLARLNALLDQKQPIPSHSTLTPT